MTKTEIKIKSGQISSLNENTGSKRVESLTWSARSVSVTVSNSSRSERVATINERLRGSGARSVSTSK